MSFDFMSEIDFISGEPNLPKNLRAALSLGDRVVATQTNMDTKRHRFSVFHEIGHYVLPEHRDKLFLDTDETLSWWTKLRLEKEANQIAADLLFQGNRFTEDAIDCDLSCRTVFDLAPKYGASYESAMRRYVEYHVLPCAVIVYDKVEDSTEGTDLEDARYRIQYTVASPSFRKRYFSGVETGGPISTGSAIYKVHGSWNVQNVVESELLVGGAQKEEWRFKTELFTNGYKIFQFLARPLSK